MIALVISNFLNFDILIKNWNWIALAIFWFFNFFEQSPPPSATRHPEDGRSPGVPPRPPPFVVMPDRHPASRTNRQRVTLCDVPRPSWRRHWGPHSARLWEPSRAWNLSRFKKLKCYFSFCRDTYFENFHVLHFI